MEINFDVAGLPVTQGSARAITHRSTGRAVLIQSNREALNAWRASIGYSARVAAAGAFAERGTPVWCTFTFRLPRPKSLPKRVLRPVSKPDLDKLARACLDAMTGVLYADDSQVVSLHVQKEYSGEAQAPGAVFVVRFGEQS